MILLFTFSIEFLQLRAALDGSCVVHGVETHRTVLHRAVRPAFVLLDHRDNGALHQNEPGGKKVSFSVAQADGSCTALLPLRIAAAVVIVDDLNLLEVLSRGLLVGNRLLLVGLLLLLAVVVALLLLAVVLSNSSLLHRGLSLSASASGLSLLVRVALSSLSAANNALGVIGDELLRDEALRDYRRINLGGLGQVNL